MVTKLLFIILFVFNVSMFKALGNQLKTFSFYYFILNVLIFKLIQTLKYFKPSKYVSRKNRAIYKQKHNRKLRKGCFIKIIILLGICLHINNINKLNIKKFRLSYQWSITINFYCLKFTQCNSERNFSLYLKKSQNKRSHSIYGNRVKTFGIKFLHFNKGNSYFKNKVNDIQISIDKFSPDIISISEANIFKTDTFLLINFQDIISFMIIFGTL